FRQLAVHQVPCRQLLVMGQAGFLERMREWVMPDVVQQRGELQADAVRGLEPDVARVFELRQRAAREMVRAERVLETAVCGAGIDEERVTQLGRIPQPPDRMGVEDRQRYGMAQSGVST